MTATELRGGPKLRATPQADATPHTDYPDAVRMALAAVAAVGVGVFLCHLPYGRIATVTLCLAGALLAGLSLLGLERRAWIGWLGAAFNAAFVIVLVGFPSQLDLTGWRPARPPAAPAQTPGMSADGWVDAGEAAWEEGGAQVALTFALVGPDPATGTSRGEPHLWIGVSVTNTGTREVKFAGWDAAAPGGPALTTADGRPVAGRRAGPFAPVALAPGKSGECVLAFEVPPTGQAVRLELPSAAYGGTTPARFLVPAELITRN